MPSGEPKGVTALHRFERPMRRALSPPSLGVLGRGWEHCGIQAPIRAIESAQASNSNMNLASTTLEAIPFQGPVDALN